MDENIFKDHTDYWNVAENIRDIYLSEGSLLTLLDFERVLDELDIYAEDQEEEAQLMEAWNEVISEVEATQTPVPFPSPPDLQIKLSNNTGMASFDYEFSGQKIVLTYVRDDNSGELLAAGSMDDLWRYKGKGILRLAIPLSCTSVTAYALYIDEYDNDILYQHSQRVPRI